MSRIIVLFVITLAMISTAHAACFDSKAMRTLLNSGKIVPLSVAASNIDGKIRSAQLCGSPGRYVYQLTVMTGTGKLVRKTVSASR